MKKTRPFTREEIEPVGWKFPSIEPLNSQQTAQIIRLESENVKLRSQVEAVKQTVREWADRASKMDIYPETVYGQRDQLFECCHELNKVLS